MKLCINCNNYANRFVPDPAFAYCLDENTAEDINTTPVDGVKRAQYCVELRAEGGKCGPDAKYFEIKRVWYLRYL